MDERLRSHYATLERVIGFTRVADAKAAPLLALQMGLAGAIVSQAAPISDTIGTGEWDAERISAVAMFGMYVLFAVGSWSMAALVYMPMTPPAEGSLIYFEDITRMKYAEFRAKSKALDQAEIEEQLLRQVHRVSGIASTKLNRVRGSMIMGAPSFAGWGTLLGLALT